MITLGKIEPAFKTASIFLLLFSAIFIWYSNIFFIKKRKKEIALYSLFGMQKEQIGKLLFFENLIIGLIALALGVGIGALFSKLFVMILMKLMGFTFLATFQIVINAVIQTIVVFFIIIAIISFNNYRIIYRNTLIQLLNAEKHAERQPKSSWISAVVSFLLLGAGYTILFQPIDSSVWDKFGFNGVLFSLLSLTIGTFLFVRAFIVTLLKKLSSFNSIYFKGINLISISSLLFRIKSNIMVLTIIALLSTITLFAIGTTTGLYYNMNKIISDSYPVSMMYSVVDAAKDGKIKQIINKNLKDQILLETQADYLKVNGDLSTTGRMGADFQINVISENTYQQLSEKLGIEPKKKLSGNESIIFYDGNLDQNTDPYTGKTVNLTEQEKVKITFYQQETLFNQDYYPAYMAISDELYQKLASQTNENKLKIYQIKNENAAGKTFDKIQNLIHDGADFIETENENLFLTRYHYYQELKQTYGLLNFISVFLGFVFLLATASILHYKQLTEATSDQPRYDILTKIGLNNKQTKQAVGKQLFLIFSIPLVLGIAHSAALLTLFARFIHLDMVLPFIFATVAYLIIHISFYFHTKHKYLSILKN